MKLALPLIAGFCCVGLFGCTNATSSKELKKRQDEVLAVGRVGAKFAEVRATLLEKGYRCPEAERLPTARGPSKERVAAVFLAERPWQSTFNESTGHNWVQAPRNAIVFEVDDEGMIIRVR